jgi:NAD(P)-dependent dehydrogenase (short-subunit alcohol dehydrogenase family)
VEFGDVMAGRLAGKVSIVCGAGSSAGGLSNGMATAVVFAREGASVLAADIDLACMEETRARLAQYDVECAFVRCDVASKQDIEAMAQACIDRFGRIDILMNNVGVQAVGGPLEVSEDDFDRLMRINVKGMFLTCRAVIPSMLRQGGGAIVNNSSVAAIRYSYPSVAYAASKGAVQQLTQNIGLQYAAKGIRCNSVLPGYIATERIISRFKKSHGDRWPEMIAERERQVPCGRLGEPWDIAHAALFLASDEAKYITGIGLIVDGGQSASTTGTISES